MDGPIGNTADLEVSVAQDRFNNTTAQATNLVVTNFNLIGVDIGALNPAGGKNVACDSNSFQVSGGGLDMASTTDIMRFVYRTVSGDFDARVRVTAFVGTNDHFETTAKAALAARESTANNSTAVNVFVTPTPPGDNTMLSNYRAATGGATNGIGPVIIPNGIPNAWMRITRQGSQFTTYHGTNGVDWIPFGTVTTAFGASMNIGVGVVSHRNGKVATATFSDFRIGPLVLPVLITNLTAGSGQFSAQFQTQNGVNYAVEYKDNLSLPMWNTLTNIAGDGALKTFSDATVSPTGARFYRVGAQ